MKYKAFLFDMNGVLIDDEHLQEEAFRQTLAELDMSLTSEDYIHFFIGKTDYKGFLDYFQSLNVTHDINELIATKGKLYQKLALGGVKGYSGVTEFIKAAANQKIKMAVVTSSMKNEAVSVLAGLKLTNYFDAIIAAEDVTNGKPDPEGYLKAAAALSADPSECIVIEDAPSGLKAAKAAGMLSIAILNTHSRGELTDASIITEKLSADLIDKII